MFYLGDCQILLGSGIRKAARTISTFLT